MEINMINWKQRLALATGAFASMSTGAIAATECANPPGLRRVRRRRISVPARVDPLVDQSIRVSVRVLSNKARRVPARCNSYRVSARLNTGSDRVFPKVEIDNLKLDSSTTFEFNFMEIGLVEPTTVAVNVDVTPTDARACASASPLTSFVLNVTNGDRIFLPMQKLDPVPLDHKKEPNSIVK